MKDLHCLFVHGVGEQPPDFAADAKRWLRGAALERGHQLFASSVHWAPLADRPEAAFLRAAERSGSRGNALQRLVVGTLSDALMYASNPVLRSQIFDLFDRQVARLRGEHLWILAHSLGGLAASDYLRARPGLRDVSLCTFGCNIGLFTLGRHFERVPQLRQGSWFNCYTPSDMLGYALAQDPSLAFVTDIPVKVGSWLTRWNGLSHTAYWNTRSFWEQVVPTKVLAL